MKKILTTKYVVSLFSFCLISISGITQTNPVNEINRIITPAVGLSSFRFLASDELMGRATARPEIHIAAKYISEAFRSMQLKECPNTSDYFQHFTIRFIKSASTGSLQIKDQTYQLTESFFELTGGDIRQQAPLIYAGHGTQADFDKLDVKGKIVITDFGDKDGTSLREGFGMIRNKRKLAMEKGAVALLERLNAADTPWPLLKNMTSREHPVVGEDNELPSFLVKDTENKLPALYADKTLSASLMIAGATQKTTSAENVMGWIEGTDPKRKDQFIVLSAHYDHLGVAAKPKMEEGKMDSIYNGARDNAIGVTAVMDAALYFSQHPPKRSMLFLAYTGEEIGEIGSKYFADNPVIPLNKMVYNMNIDNASYNDTKIISVVGLGRTSADQDIKKGAEAFGLTAIPDPAPEQNLFDRSDNVNLAVKGIPAPTFSLGFTSFDATVTKRYHQLSDEVGNFDLDYAMKYIKAYIMAAKNIADNPIQPTWIKGDKYEPAWKKLFQQ